MFVDSHCHLDRLDYDKVGSLDEILESARRRKVQAFLCIATHLDGFQNVADIAEQHADVFCTSGVHPLQKNIANLDSERLLDQASNDLVVAVGETGLDYYYAAETKEAQLKSFAAHIEVAKSVQKPLIIHTRDAPEDTMRLLREHQAHKAGAVMHCFTESLEMAKEAIELGFYISFSGILTFRTAESLRETAKALPLDRILIETDCPWLAPVPYRGRENQPAYVVEVAHQLAEIHDVSVESIAEQTTKNFYNCFKHIPKPTE